MKTYSIGQDGFLDPKEIVAILQKAPSSEDVTFLLRGEIGLKQPIVLSAEDLCGRKVIFQGADGACFSGGRRVTGFFPVGDNCYAARIPEVEYTRNLYIDGKFAFRPTTEKTESKSWKILTGNYRFVEEEHPEHGIVTPDRTPLTWKNICDVEMVFDVGWTHHVIPIREVREQADGSVRILPLVEPFVASCQPAGVKIGACPNWFENVFEQLSNPLEWYFDRNDRMLYVCFAPGDCPENHVIEIPLCEQLIHIAGTPEHKAAGIEFRNIAFKNSAFLRPALYGFSNLQGEFTRENSVSRIPKKEEPYELDPLKVPAAVRLVAARQVRFVHCSFTCLGNTALSMEYGTEDCAVERCRFFELGAGAVTVGDVMSDRAHHPKRDEETVRKNRIENCEICHTGKDLTGTAALMLGYVQECGVCHNHIHDVPYTAVSVGWGWGRSDISVGPYRPTPWKTPTVCQKNRIAYNHIHDHMQKRYDGGAIYTLGAMEGTVICGNLIHQAGAFSGMLTDRFLIVGYATEELNMPKVESLADVGYPGGIYLDEGSRGIAVYDNQMYDVPVPIHYHNRIDLGYTMVQVYDNGYGARPGTPAFREELASAAGITRENENR